MSLHTSFEQIDDIAIVWILCESQTSAVVHKFFEFFRLVFAQFFNLGFLLLFLDVGVFLSFRSSWKTLPWE